MAAGAGIHDRMKAGGFGLISIEVGLTLTLTLALTLTLTLGGPGGAAGGGGACQPSARRSDACGLVQGAA